MRSIGLDFGTESLRGVVVDTETGEEIGGAVAEYPVLDGKYHDPDGYLRAMERVLAESGPADAIGVAATSSSVLPCKADGTPVSRLTKNPHALVKIWKNHDARLQADRINAVAAERGEKWLRRYGRVSSEWFFPKVWHTLVEAPDVYRLADRFVEKGDWIVWQLTGRETRSSCAAGYKALWHKRDGFPSRGFFAELDPNLADPKMTPVVTPVGTVAGSWRGIPVSTAIIDAHAAVPAAGITGPGTMLLVMGTSLCHMVLADREVEVPGMCGVVEDGILPGYFGYESGQAAAGDVLAWFTREFNLPHEGAPEPGRLVAVDWWNGSRDLRREDLTGVLFGLTLETKPAEIYRALLESLAFGTRRIIESYEGAGVPIRDLRACGGLAEKNPSVVQVFADVTGREIRMARSKQATAVGAALLAAGLPPIRGVRNPAVTPDPTRHEAYERSYRVYLDLRERFLAPFRGWP